ncbi:Uncharacterized protein NV38_0000706 [Leptospira kirschneri serovar Mozdok]|nr:Uncharacterized protein NV38_0000706 [Leptospira kirschneri serovar Mozdok]
MNELKHNTLYESRWKLKHNAFLRVALWSQVIEIKEIECITIAHNNLTGAKSPVPPVLV